MRHPDGQRDGSADRTGTPTVGYKKTDPGYPDRFVEKMATPTLASDRIGLPEFALFRPLRRAVRPVLPATVRFSGRPECGTATNGTRSLTNETAHRVLRKLRAKPRSRRRFPRRAIPEAAPATSRPGIPGRTLLPGFHRTLSFRGEPVDHRPVVLRRA